MSKSIKARGGFVVVYPAEVPADSYRGGQVVRDAGGKLLLCRDVAWMTYKERDYGVVSSSDIMAELSDD